MVSPTVGQVILVPFPFSDLSRSKLRPAVVLAHAGREDWVLCQVTSSPYGDPSAIAISDECFSQGSLRINSFARPGKLFTASSTLMLSEVGTLKVNVARQIIRAIIMILRSGIEQGDVEHGTPG